MKASALRPELIPGIAFLLALLAVARIVSTYWALNHTIDEPTHVLCGIEWLREHRYTLQLENPPLARIAAGIGPLLVGAHGMPKEEMARKGPLVFYGSPSYDRTLASARAGELPFFLLATGTVWFWAKRLHGSLAALLAVLLFTTLPPVLGHAGLATTDMAAGATLPLSVYAFWRWMEQGGWKPSLLLSLAIAAGVLTKFTFLFFFPLCAGVVLLFRDRKKAESRVTLGNAAMVLGVAVVLVWALYRFDITPVPTDEGPGGLIAHLPGSLQAAVRRSPTVRLPLGTAYMGIVEARAHNFYGHLTYLLGKTSTTGWWYFFPVVFAHKTPLAFLALTIAACALLRRSPREHWISVACAFAILISVLPSRLDLGVRHILAMYPLLAIPAGMAAARLLQSASRLQIGIAVVLLCWQVVASVRSHPDYIAYFNELSFGEPEYVRVDSDLDWGQSVKRLVDWKRERNLKGPIGFAGFGSTNPAWHGLEYYPADPWRRSTGWVAVSATERMLPQNGGARRGQAWSWLDAYEPEVRLAGSSILIYNIPAPN